MGHRPTGTTLINTHTSANTHGDWSTNSPFADLHRSQLAQLAETINAAKRPVVITGDLNIAAGSVFYREFRDQIDVIDAFETDERPTFRPDFLPPGRKAQRIDYILVAGSSLTSINSDLALHSEEAVLDHLGLLAALNHERL